MAIQRVVKMNRRQYVLSTLRDEIAGFRYRSGDCLPPIKVLAERFGTSVAPIHQALVILEEEGLVERRVGSGTFVTGKRPVADPMQTALFSSGGHLFGDFSSMLLRHLHARNIYPVSIDGGQPDTGEMIRFAAESARLLLIQGSGHFNYSALNSVDLDGKHLIGFFEWADETLRDRVHRVLVDHSQGAATVAQTLWEHGHRKLLLLGTSSMVNPSTGQCHSQLARNFAKQWREHGGELVLAASHAAEGRMDVVLDSNLLLDALRDSNPPTAIFGLRDFEAAQAKVALLKHGDPHLEALPIIGYGNTPWSDLGIAQFSSMDWNLETMAEQVFIIADAVLEGRDPGAPKAHLIAPTLVQRGSLACPD